MIRWLFPPVIAAALWLAAVPTASADNSVLEITVGYRERIAPPPDAVLEVMLLDVSRADIAAPRLSSQRFVLTGVPMTVTLSYDPALIDENMAYSVSAAILSGDKTVFRTTAQNPALTRDAPDSLDLVLTKMTGSQSNETATQRITGVAWAIYEIGGEALDTDDPPTLTLDAEGRFGLYSGCNRFTGTADINLSEQGGGTIVFPENFAGTLMACPEDREKLQSDVLKAISTIAGYVREGDLLTMTDADGGVVLRLKEQLG